MSLFRVPQTCPLTGVLPYYHVYKRQEYQQHAWLVTKLATLPEGLYVRLSLGYILPMISIDNIQLTAL